MKNIVDALNESLEFNPSFRSHRDTWNSFVKWYDKQLNHMNKEELVDMLKDIVRDIEADELDIIK